jgi:hypothetical protein
MMTLNRTGELMLVVGRRDWRLSGAFDVTLGVDDAEFAHLQANAFNNLVLLLITNGAVLRRLTAAKDIYWHFPFGQYHASVVGFGDALAWVRQCERAKRSDSGIGG